MVGVGPLSLTGFYLTADGRQVVASDHFVSVQGHNFSTADDYYPWLAGIAGFYPDFDRFPVVVLPQAQYQRKTDSWSMGTYQEGGLILLRNATLQRGSNLSILLHEAMHGFNAKALRWDETKIAWFDEGVAKFVEFLVNSKRAIPQAQIFGEEYYFDRDGRSYYLEPRKRPEDLWSYYQGNQSFMRYWTPSQGNREFGYAFSELFIRKYVLEEGFGRLRRVYSQLLAVDRRIEDREERTDLILSKLERDLRPCLRPTRSQLETCLAHTRNRTYDVPLTEVGRATQEVQIPQLSYQLEEPEQKRAERQPLTNNDKETERSNKIVKTNFLARLMRQLEIWYWDVINWWQDVV